MFILAFHKAAAFVGSALRHVKTPGLAGGQHRGGRQWSLIRGPAAAASSRRRSGRLSAPASRTRRLICSWSSSSTSTVAQWQMGVLSADSAAQDRDWLRAALGGLMAKDCRRQQLQQQQRLMRHGHHRDSGPPSLQGSRALSGWSRSRPTCMSRQRQGRAALAATPCLSFRHHRYAWGPAMSEAAGRLCRSRGSGRRRTSCCQLRAWRTSLRQGVAAIAAARPHAEQLGTVSQVCILSWMCGGRGEGGGGQRGRRGWGQGVVLPF